MSLRQRAVLISLLALSLGSIAAGAAWPKGHSRAPVKQNPPTCDRSKFQLILDVGHTPEARGATSARNAAEFDFNLRLAKRIQARLQSEGFADSYFLVTDGLARPSLLKRVAAINEIGADLVLSIHHDSVPDKFLEDWEFDGGKAHFSDRFSGHSIFVSHQNPKFATSLRFARLLGRQIKAQGLSYARQYSLPLMGRYRHVLLDKEVGVYRYDQLVVLERTNMPAVLLEAGSIINRDEELAMATPERQDRIVAAVSAAAKEFCETR